MTGETDPTNETGEGVSRRVGREQTEVPVVELRKKPVHRTEGRQTDVTVRRD